MTIKLPAAAGEGWTIFNGVNEPAEGLCQVILVREYLGDYWDAQIRPAPQWDWSLDGDSGDIIAFREYVA